MSMKIYFCDGCNESVPLADIQSGRVTTIKGKLFCGNCLPPGVLDAPRAAAPPAERSSGPSLRDGLQTALVVALLLVVGLFVWSERGRLFGGDGAGDGTPSRAEGGRTAVLDDVDRLSAQMLQIEADLNRLGRDVNSLGADLEVLRAADADHDRAVTRIGEEIDRLVEVQVESGGVVERVHLLDGRTTSLQERLTALADAVAAHEAALSLAASRPAAAAQGAGGGGKPAASAEPEVDPVRAKEIETLRRLLLDEAPDLRFDAIERVAVGRYEELVPELVKRLGDSDMFVRMYAMEVLADFGAEQAVDPLFDALDDGNATIRRTAAEALVRLLGYDPGYDAKASSAERKRSVEAWREWYAAR